MYKFFKIFVVCCLLFLNGCAASALIGPAVQLGIAWKEGEAHKYYPHTQKVMVSGVTRALNKLGLPINKSELKKGVYYIHAGRNDRFKIKIVATETTITSVGLRVNTMGDKDYAELIYKTIEDGLGVIDCSNSTER